MRPLGHRPGVDALGYREVPSQELKLTTGTDCRVKISSGLLSTAAGPRAGSVETLRPSQALQRGPPATNTLFVQTLLTRLGIRVAARSHCWLLVPLTITLCFH